MSFYSRQRILIARSSAFGAIRMFLRLLASALLLVSLPAASAQAAPEVDLSIALPPGPVTIELGGSHEVPFEVSLTLRGVVCASASQVKVPLTVKDKPSPLAGVSATADPTELVFDVPSGQYTSTPFTQTAESVLTIDVASSAPASHQHAFEVVAAFAGGVPSGCQGTGTAPASEARATHAIVTGSAPPAATPPHQMGDGSTMGGGAMNETKNDTPGPGVFVALLAVLIGLAARRR